MLGMSVVRAVVIGLGASVAALSANGGLIEPASRDTDLGVSQGFDWNAAVEQSFFFLTFQHAFRLTQDKTADELRGPFFGDYWRAAGSLKGWRDGDSSFTNYVAHPMQGAVASYIQIQNDPRGATLQFSADPEYW